MLVTTLRCWWLIQYPGWPIHYMEQVIHTTKKVTNIIFRHQHLKTVTIIKLSIWSCRQHHCSHYFFDCLIQKRLEKEAVHSIDWHIFSLNSSSWLITVSKNVKIHLNMKILAKGSGSLILSSLMKWYKLLSQEDMTNFFNVEITCIGWAKSLFTKLFWKNMKILQKIESPS